MVAHSGIPGPLAAADLAGMSPHEFRRMCRGGQYSGLTRGVALGYLQCNLVVLRQRYAYDFLVYCQRNQRSCPVLEICDAGDPEPRELAAGADGQPIAGIGCAAAV